nr:MAG TPA: hypothetical protein [Caudoviricetes sp.]
MVSTTYLTSNILYCSSTPRITKITFLFYP